MKKFDIGVYGLGVMGSSIAKNMLSHNFNTAIYSKSRDEREKFVCENSNYEVFENEESFIDSLESPKKIFIMITSGSPVDEVIEKIAPMLKEGDIIIDGGNSFYRDTERREIMLEKQGIRCLGMGISGGEKGALYGPSIMAGGILSAYKETEHIFSSIAAKHESGVCLEYIGKGGAGHYAKMVHNGIEYAMLEAIADAYYIMKNIMSLSHREISALFEEWKNSDIASYLIDITSLVFKKNDTDGMPLLEKVLDITRQKGTGKAAFIEGFDRGVYIPTICESVFARYVSMEKNMRKFGESILPKKTLSQGDVDIEEKDIKGSLYAAFIIAFSQGLMLIEEAGKKEMWNIDMAKLVSVWKNGCIIRGRFLEDIIDSLTEEPQSKNILFTKNIRQKNIENSLRKVVLLSVKNAAYVPALSSALTYYDSIRTANMGINLVSALRDVFGSHCYERTDKEGFFHSDWEN